MAKDKDKDKDKDKEKDKDKDKDKEKDKDKGNSLIVNLWKNSTMQHVYCIMVNIGFFIKVAQCEHCSWLHLKDERQFFAYKKDRLDCW